jgi:transcriptional regulator with PAS, ATPase and Fis domain
MAEEISWEGFEKLHVVRKLRQIIAERWKIQLNFSDAKGMLRNVEKGKFFSPLTPACVRITASEKGFKECLATVRELSAAKSKSKNQKIATCHAGFSAITYPLIIDGTYIGSIFADGFVLAEQEKSQLAQVKSYLQQFYQSDKELTDHLKEIPILSADEVTFLSELIGAIIEEIVTVHKSLNKAEAKVASLQQQLEGRFSFANMVGKSAPMQQLFQLIERLAEVDSTVLIQGENGTGKELIAKALHFNSPRKKHKFLAVNCGALNENLLESELFGHVKGAFTNAIKDKVGLFEAAQHGTLFLDEIGDISMAMQVKLLRVIQDRTFLPVGGIADKITNARIVCATNKDLLAMIDEGSFREDLYYRLNVINVQVPPLRERADDIPLLVDSFLKSKCAKLGQSPKQMSHGALQNLMNYEWPGNIRELENEIERVVVLGKDTNLITEASLSARIAQRSVKRAVETPRLLAATQNSDAVDLKSAVVALEKELIKEGLLRTKGNKTRLANELGISRANLISKVEKYGLG